MPQDSVESAAKRAMMNCKLSRIVKTADGLRIIHTDPQVEELSASFLGELKARGLSPQTIGAYGYDLVHFFRWLGTKHISEFSYQELFEYLKFQADCGAKPRSINRRIVVCRLYLQFLSDRNFSVHQSHLRPRSMIMHARMQAGRWINRRGMVSLRVKQPFDIVEPLTTDDVNEVLAKCKRYRDLSIILLMTLVGLRRGEILSLKRADVNSEGGMILIRGKGRKERSMPLPSLVSKSLFKYLQHERPRTSPSDKLFLVLQGHSRGRPMTIGGIRSIFRSRRVSTGVHHANPHRFRHTFANSMIKNGVSILVLQKMLGHARYETTLRYSALTTEDIADQYFKALKLIEARHEDQKIET